MSRFTSPEPSPEPEQTRDTRSHPVWGLYDRLRTARLNVKYYGFRLRRFKRLNLACEIVLSTTAPSSAAAALWFWQTGGGKLVWQGLSVVAAIAAVMRQALKLTSTITEHEGLVTGYRLLEYDLEAIKIAIEQVQRYDEPLQAEFQKTRTKERDLVSREPLDPADPKLRRRCESEVLRELPLEAFFIPNDKKE